MNIKPLDEVLIRLGFLKATPKVDKMLLNMVMKNEVIA